MLIDTDDPVLPEELTISAEAQQRGILKALRVILEVPEGESILITATTVMCRYKAWQRQSDAANIGGG
jgi:hypothetical protein